MTIALRRAYEPPAAGDGRRVLVDRLWPRGLSKAQLQIDEWARALAPSDPLRQALHGGRMTWGEFRRRYIAELKARRGDAERLARLSRGGGLTLVFGARDGRRNNAAVLAQYLRMLGAGPRAGGRGAGRRAGPREV